MNYGKSGIKKRQAEINARGPKWSRKLLLWLLELVLVAVIGVGIVGASFGIGVFKSILSTAPDISKITVTPTGRSSFVYDSEGNQIQKLVAANANRIPVSSDKIPEDLKNAFVAIEDKRFYSHNGIDIEAIMRAAMMAVRKRGLAQGGSTITQQLLKNNVFTEWAAEKNNIEKIKRKVQEQYLAVQLEKVMSKDEILTNYANTINLGHNTLGVQSASLRYFNKDVSELNLSECALIASITNNPSAYNPILHPEANNERREMVLDEMYSQGFISESEYKTALADNPYERINQVNEVLSDQGPTTYFVDALTDQLERDLAAAGYNRTEIYTLLYSSGLTINSTLDPKIQAICDEVFANEENYPAKTYWQLSYKLSVTKEDGSVENHSTEMFRRYFRQKNSKFNMLYRSQEDAYAAIEEYQQAVLSEGDEILAESVTLTPQPQMSFTVENQHTGQIVAMVGGRGTKEVSRGFNRATDAARQPGSCFKVLAAFAPAIDSCGMTLATVYNDAPFNYYNGTPVSNWYGEEYKGLCNLRYGVYWSLNVVAVKTITQISPQLGYNYLQNFGISTLVDGKLIGDMIYSDIGQPLALGGITDGVLNYELNAAYASIANGGVYIEPKMYTTVVDPEGNVILDATQPTVRQTVSPQTAYLLTSAMKDCVTIGTGTNARFPGMSIAGKTGTTSSGVDVWFAGYTPYYTATAWAGYDNNNPLTNEEQQLPQKMFARVMRQVHEDLPDPGFTEPDGIVKMQVCKKSGKLPIPGLCDGDLYTEIFDENNVPTESCDVHYMGAVCGYDNLPAAPQCPFIYDGVVTVNPVEDESLWQGSQVITNEIDPLAVGTRINTTGHCQHDEIFFTTPGWEALLQQQQIEYEQRVNAVLAAQAAGQQ